MDLEVLQFELKPDNFKLGCALVRYGELMIECELVYYSPKSKVWIRMPEKWETPQYKKHYAFWSSKKTSDEFQTIIVNKIFENYDLTREEVIKIHEKISKKKQNKRKP